MRSKKIRMSSYVDRGNQLIANGKTPEAMKLVERGLQHYTEKIINAISPYAKSDAVLIVLVLRHLADEVERCNPGVKDLYVEELVERNPCLRIEQVKEEKKKKTAFTEIDVEKLRLHCISRRQSAIVEMFMSTGCRVSELVQMRVDDLKGDRIVVHGKGNKDRVVYLNAKAQMAVQQYLLERSDTNPYLFPKGKPVSVVRMKGKPALWYINPENVEKDGHTDKSCIESECRRLGRRAGVDRCHPHRFRRTCATFALRRGMPIEQVSKMLGHEEISTTQIYLDLSEEDLLQAHKKFVV